MGSENPCFNINAANVLDEEYYSTDLKGQSQHRFLESGEPRSATHDEWNYVKQVVEDNSGNCRYNTVCKNSLASNYSNPESFSTHDEDICVFDNNCKDPNALNVTSNLNKGKHVQSECTYRDSCPYDGVNIKNSSSDHSPVARRDNCQFKEPKCLNPRANNLNETSNDNLDTDQNFNYGCTFTEGCTSKYASNYEETATIDDRSCRYRDTCPYKGVNITNSDVSHDIQDGMDNCQFKDPKCLNPRAINFNDETSEDNLDQEEYFNYGCRFTEGCTYTEAENYNPTATIDNQTCTYKRGCTYSIAENYVPDAKMDDGTCIFNRNLFKQHHLWKSKRGCLDDKNDNYDATAEYDYKDMTTGLSSCSGGETTVGCIEPTALDYNENATMQVEPCNFGYVSGCTYEEASNYNSKANLDDGSCKYELENNMTYTIIILVLVLIILGMGYKLLG